jgi:hypothetical protein
MTTNDPRTTNDPSIRLDFTKNPLVARYAKGLVTAAFGLIQIANVWAEGPSWLYIAAAIVAGVLVPLVPNAPMYKDPRTNHLKAAQ